MALSARVQKMMASWKGRTYRELQLHNEKKHKAILLIQRSWRDCNENPKYKVCRRRLLLEFAEFSAIDA